MKLISKISTKTVYGAISVKELIQAKDSTLKIMRVIGKAGSIKTGESDKGPWVAFLGQFEATNLKTGEVSMSSKLFPPSNTLTEMLQGLLSTGNQSVDVAFDVSAKYDESAITKYVYEISTLPGVRTDLLANLRARVETSQLPKADTHSSMSGSKTKANARA